MVTPSLEVDPLLGGVPTSARGRTVSGGHGGGVTPVPIPNTVVKPASADGTWGVAPWESRTPPEFLRQQPSAMRGAVVASGGSWVQGAIGSVGDCGTVAPDVLGVTTAQPNRILTTVASVTEPSAAEVA